MLNELLENINNRNYEYALTIFKDNFNAIKDNFENEITENNNINTFDFLEYIGKHTNTEEIISFISINFSTSLCHYKNGYKYGYYYAKKLIRINPKNIENWEWLLFFYDLPTNKLMDKNKLKKIVKKLLAMDKDNKLALQAIKMYKL